MPESQEQQVDSDQYNQIADAYSVLYPPDGDSPSNFPLGAIEKHQIYLAVTDPSVDIRGKRVLDLACGSGHYANHYLNWGAASVTGMDVSTGMLEAGRRSAEGRGIPESKLKFVQGDATDENLVIEGAPFDVVTGCWLLNYAPDTATMTTMYKFIARNLRPDGYWVGLSVPPLLSDAPYEADMINAALGSTGVWGKHGNLGKILKAMPNGDGFLINVELGTEAHKVKASFDCYHLSLKVFEQACHDSGVFENPEWRDFVIPEHAKNGSFGKGYWNSLCLWPHCRVFTAKKRV